MRATGCLCALLGALLALQAGIAEAEITPLPRPARTPASDGGSLIAPVSRPETPTTIRPATTPPASPSGASMPTLSTPGAAGRAAVATASIAPSQALVPTAAGGGREQEWVPPSGGGRDESLRTTATALAPTPVGLAGAGGTPSHEDSWPFWLTPLLTLLTAIEAFVLVRLVRARLARAREIEI
jgi:hypothetical protein